MHVSAFLTFVFMALFSMVMAMPLEPEVHLAKGAAGEYDQSRGVVDATESTFSARTEGLDPVAEDTTPKISRKHRTGCARGHKFCGHCNGTSCRMAYVNLPCREGTCVRQRGGGDGKYCGGPRTGYMICPGW